MKKTMRVISVILSLAMLLALLPVMGLTTSANEPSAQAEVDLLEGAGVFAGKIPSGFMLTTSNTYDANMSASDDGTGALKLTHSDSGGRVSVEVGSIYTVKAKIYAAVANKNVVWNIYQYATSTDSTVAHRLANVYMRATEANTWQEVEIPFVANYPSLIFSARNDTTGDVWFDEVQLVKHTEHALTDFTSGTCGYKACGTFGGTGVEGVENSRATTCGASIAKPAAGEDELYGFGSFDNAETGKVVWAPESGSSIENGYIKMTGANVFSTNKLPVKADTAYEFSFKFKTEGTGTLSSDIRVNGSTSYRVANIQLYTGSAYTGSTVFTITALSDGWYEYKTLLKIPAATAEAAGGNYFTFTHNPLANTSYFDDIVLKEHIDHKRDDLADLSGCCTSKVYSVPASVIASGGSGWAAYGAACGVDLSLPEGTNLLGDNGNMDSQEDVTSFFLGTNTTYDATENAAAQKASAALQTALKKIKANQIYTLKFSLKSTAGLNFGISSDTNLTSNMMRWIAVGSTGGQWVEKSFTFKMPANVTTFSVRALASSAVYYLKDFSFTEHIHDDGATVDGVCETRYYYPTSGNPNPPASEVCGADATHFTGAQGVLGEDVRLDLSVATSLSNLTVKLDAADFAGNILQRDDLEIDVVDGKASIAFPAKNMADKFTATLMDGETVKDTVTYSVKEYAETVIATGNEAAVAAAKAMLNYGASAQTYFNYKTSTLANAGLDAADQVIDVENIVGVGGEEEEEDTTPPVMVPKILGSYNDSVFPASYQTLVSDYPHGPGFKIEPTTTLSAQFSYARFGHTTNNDMVIGKQYKASFWAKLTGAGTQTVLYKRTNTTPWVSLLSVANADGNWHYYEVTFDYSDINTGYLGINFQNTISAGNKIEFSGFTVQEVYDDGEMISNPNGANISSSLANGWAAFSNVTLQSAGYDADIGQNALTFSGNGAWVWISMKSGVKVEVGKTYEISYLVKHVLTETGAVDNSKGFAGHGVSSGQASPADTANSGALVYASTTPVGETGWNKVVYHYTPSESIAGKTDLRAVVNVRAGYTCYMSGVSVKEYVEPEVVLTPVQTYQAGVTVTDDAMKSVFKGYSLVLRDKTYTRLYFTEAITSELPAGATAGTSGNLYYVELPAVKAAALDEVGELAITTDSGTVTITNYSALAPAALVATKDTTLGKVCCALILYAEAVNALQAV